MLLAASLAATALPTHADPTPDEAIDPASSIESASALPAPPSEAAVVVEYKTIQANRVAMLFSPDLQFRNAKGTPAFFQEVFDYHCRVARAGNADGYYVMGMLYIYGSGAPKNLSMASTLLRKAADLDHARAKAILEVMPRPPKSPEMPACITAPPATQEAAASDEVAQFYKRDGKVHQLVSRLAPEYGIDIDLAMAVIAVESGFNARATSPKNAQGLMQLIPDTARRFQVRDSYDPEQNVKGGLAYLRVLLDQFEGNVRLATAAYNAGEKTIEKYGGVPPYPETQLYVEKIRSLYPKSTHPYRDRMGRVIGHTVQ